MQAAITLSAMSLWVAWSVFGPCLAPALRHGPKTDHATQGPQNGYPDGKKSFTYWARAKRSVIPAM